MLVEICGVFSILLQRFLFFFLSAALASSEQKANEPESVALLSSLALRCDSPMQLRGVFSLALVLELCCLRFGGVFSFGLSRFFSAIVVRFAFSYTTVRACFVSSSRLICGDELVQQFVSFVLDV
jgi:hypothetical protein